VRSDVSQRHISFIETGRSRPSKEMVLHLAQTLDVSPREQNLLLLAAGHAPAYAETPLDQLEQVSGAIDFMLQAHEPNIAIVVDRHWNIMRSNRTAMAFTSLLFPEPPSWITQPLNLMRLSFHPDGIRRHLVDWESTAAALLRRLERDAASHPSDGGLAQLVDEIRSYPGVDRLSNVEQGPGDDLLVPATYAINGDEVSLFTTIARIGDAHDLTLAELRLETFWPADSDSAQSWARITDSLSL